MPKTVFGLLLLSLTSLAHAATTQPAAPQSDDSEQVSFVGDNGVKLVGTLRFPDRRIDGTATRYPAVVLLAGSGPTDRDDNQPPTEMSYLLRDVADALASQGIASLRYDKRGMYASRPTTKPAEDLNHYFALDHFAGDAAAAVRYLRGRADIDAAHVGIVGHSEGGLLALMASKTLRDEGAPPAALVLMAAAGRPLRDVLEEQLAALMKRQNAPQAVATALLNEARSIDDTLIKTATMPETISTPIAALYPRYLGLYFQQLLPADGSAFAAQYTGPVLVVQGTDDIQISADRDATALVAALAGRPHDQHDLHLAKGCTHFFKPSAGPADPGFAGMTDPNTLSTLARWTRTHLATP